jgi:hypothetical protein
MATKLSCRFSPGNWKPVASKSFQRTSGDGALSLYEKDGPFAIVLADYRFSPGVNIKDCMQLVTALHEINQLQQMAIMTADPQDARRNLPNALRRLPILRKPFRIEQVPRLLRQPVPPL